MKVDDYTGQVLNERYRVERLLGSGGMGAVYEGRHAIVGKRVAIKMLHADLATNEEVLKRFYREAQAAAAIGHKNIIDVMDVGVTPANEPYMVMEYLEGEDLESMLARTGSLAPEAACGILEPVLMALSAAHDKEIVHRDLKPANIFLCRSDDGRPIVKLIDFGISKISGGAGGTKLTQTGSLLGTPAYMSPEQARGGQDVDHRTDIYSMGVILYQMLTGELPFKGDNYNSLLISVLTEAPPPPSELNPKITPEVEALVLRELSKDPAARSQSAAEMLQAFEKLTSYVERASGMTLLGSQIRSDVAGGDLGSPKSGMGSQSSGSRVLSQRAKGTPGVWSGTEAKKGSRAGLAVGIVAALMLVLGVVAVVLLKGGYLAAPVAAPALPVPTTTPIARDVVTEPVEAEPAPKPVVEIHVVGAPEGAEILFDGAVVPVNPFSVEPKEALVKIEVRAPGYESFATMIAPSTDREVPVSLKLEVKKSGGGRRGDAKARNKSAAAPVPAPSGNTLKKGKRGTKFGKDFE